MMHPVSNAAGKVGLFGGTFDPPTIAHFIAAEWALELLDLDQVWFIPNLRNPLKNSNLCADPETRVDMLKSASDYNPAFRIETCEFDREAPSFTVDTINYLSSRYPDTSFTLLIGSDVLDGFDHWRQPEQILQQAGIAVFTRGGHVFSSEAERWLDQVQLVEIPRLELSSTLVRQMVGQARSIRYLVPLEVEKIIRDRKLYRR